MSKSKLNIYCQKSHISAASYDTVKEGDIFVSKVTVSGVTYKSVRGSDTKKEAEQDAAAVALQGLVQLHSTAASVDDLLATLESGTKRKKGSAKQSVEQQTPEPPIPITQVGSAGVCKLNSSPTSDMGPVVGSSYSMPSSVIQTKPVPAHPVGQPRALPMTMPFGRPSRASHREMVVQGRDPPYWPRGVVGFQALRPPGLPPVPLSIPIHHNPHPSPAQAISPPPPPPGSVPTCGPKLLNNVPVTQRPEKAVTSVRNFEEELVRYCLERSLPQPVYHINENQGSYCGRVVVNGVEYVGCTDQTSFLLARKSAALVALASVGLQALRLQEQATETGVTTRGEPQSAGEAQTLSGSNCRRSVSPVSVSSTARVHSESTLSGSASSPPPSVGSAATPASLQLQSPSYFSENSTHQVSSCPGALSSTQSQQTVQHLSSVQGRGHLAANKMSNYKVALTAYCQKKGLDPPQYECTYPEDAVGYIVTVHVKGQAFTSKTEGTKRGAESTAASLALSSFGEVVEVGVGGATNGTSVKNGGELVEQASVPAEERNISYKNILQEYLQKSHVTELPRYSTERTDGKFISTVAVRIAPEKSERYEGTPHANKKAAEQESARVACYELKLVT